MFHLSSVIFCSVRDLVAMETPNVRAQLNLNLLKRHQNSDFVLMIKYLRSYMKCS